MSEALPKTRPVQGSEWMVAIRDYQFNVTPHEFAVGSLYGTCGNWGQHVWLSDVSVEKILHIKRETASKVRKSLLAKGLIEDTGQHGKQPSQREYRLTLPVEMPLARDFKGDAPQTDTPSDASTALYGGDAPQTDTPCPPNGHPDAPQTDRGCPSRGAQELDLDLEVEIDHHVDDGVSNPQDQGQSQDQEPGLDDIPSERLSNWLETLPGSARRDAEHKVAVCYRQFESRPLLPNAARPRSVIRYLSKGEAESMMNTSTHPALCDYLQAHLTIQFRAA